MIKSVKFDLSEIMPNFRDVLKSQGSPNGKEVPEKVHQLFIQALELINSIPTPRGMFKPIPIDEFERVFKGEGENEQDTPLEHIYPCADYLALFAMTLGREISSQIETLFSSNDFALAYMLDCVASQTAEKAVKVVESEFHRFIDEQGAHVLAYSPGYCGWHVSGQRKLFKYLEPGKIDILLNESCLMVPLKSVTGVLVAGEKKIHQFKPNYSFCRDCKDRTCNERMKNLNQV